MKLLAIMIIAAIIITFICEISRAIARMARDVSAAVGISLDGLTARVDALSCELADDGEDKVVNRHLRKRADQLDRTAGRLNKRANRLCGRS